MTSPLRRFGLLTCALLVLANCGDDSTQPTGGKGGASAGGGGATAGGAGGAGGDSPSCCGCLACDAAWSCSKETCLAADGTALELLPEAGFLELPGVDYSSYHGAGQSPRQRVWYSFQPAESSPADKPLLLLFNGIAGPALGVLAFNTGHYTFDSTYTNGADFAENPSRWTDFANVLYIDEPGAGYSYNLPRADGSSPPVDFDAYAQAGDYLRIVFRFLARHPQLANAPIVIAGESGGGVRGTYMTKIMLDYTSLLGGDTYTDAELYEEIAGFLHTRRTDIDPADWTPADIVQVFTHQIFIDPYFTHYQWDYWMTLQGPETPGCDPDPDPLDCSETPAEAQVVFDHLVHVATDPTLFSQVLRCDVTSIEWLYASARTGAYERHEFANGTPADQTALVAVFGELEPQDSYYVFSPNDTRFTWDLGPAFAGLEENQEHGLVALRTFVDVPTFVTNGLYDLRFNAKFIPEALAGYTDVLSASVLNPTEPLGAARPGQFELTYVAGLPYFDGGTIIIPNPVYAAGHSVSHHAPAELKADVQAFLGGP
ncbi:MAG: hypothetical protein U0271_02385 [Polyangiaceae bacterium]